MNRCRNILNGLFLLLVLSTMALADTVTVSILNSQSVPIYVSFTTLTQAPGVITWNSSGNGCVNTGKGANAAYTQINAGQTCTASVDTSSSSSRFCATTNAAPAQLHERPDATPDHGRNQL